MVVVSLCVLLLLLWLLQAKPFADFLSLVLRWEPESRATAEQLLKHPWLQPTEHLIHMNEYFP